MIRGYHEYISKLSLENELDLLKYRNIDIPTSILTQNKLKRTIRCCEPLMLQNRKIGAKTFGELEVIRQTFSPKKRYGHARLACEKKAADCWSCA